MKLYNKKLKELGWNHDPEESSTSYDTYKWVSEGLDVIKTMVITHRGDADAKSLISSSMRRNKTTKEYESEDTWFSAHEIDAIKDYFEAHKFFNHIEWEVKDGKYKIKEY